MDAVSLSRFDQTGGWSFIPNKIDINFSLPFEIAPGIVLRKANATEIEKIKSYIRQLVGEGGAGMEFSYEHDCVKKQIGPGSFEYSYTPLSSDKWRYFIVETDDNGRKAMSLQFASSVSLAPLDVTALKIHNNGGVGWRAGAIQRYCQLSSDTDVLILGEPELLDLRASYSEHLDMIDNDTLEPKYPEITRALQLLDNLILLPTSSEFQILGLFAIIEMLITHNPHLEDRGDSITHQMQSKIPLLSRRFPHPISYEKFFGTASEKKIWSALYKFRSAIAHGGVADFSKPEMKILKDAKSATCFVEEVTRKMIRHAFREPLLYRDIKNC